MERDRKNVIEWIKKHKTELCIAGISITTILLIILGIKNRDALVETRNELNKIVKGITLGETKECRNVAINVDPIENKKIPKGMAQNKIPHEVCEHLRNLPEGWNASIAKQVEAIEHGYVLEPGQTWVSTYRTGCNVA